jgi:hypothetical protein
MTQSQAPWFLGRSPDSRIVALPTPSHSVRAVARSRSAPRLQWRYRDGLTPSSLLSSFGTQNQRFVVKRAKGLYSGNRRQSIPARPWPVSTVAVRPGSRHIPATIPSPEEARPNRPGRRPAAPLSGWLGEADVRLWRCLMQSGHGAFSGQLTALRGVYNILIEGTSCPSRGDDVSLGRRWFIYDTSAAADGAGGRGAAVQPPDPVGSRASNRLANGRLGAFRSHFEMRIGGVQSGIAPPLR